SGGNILIGVHFSSETANVEIRRLIGVGVTGLLLLLASLIGAYLLGRWAARPIKTLAAAANLVQANKLDEVPQLEDSPVKELSSALGAFNAMVLGLKERERIRDLFGKYVPQNVANLLVADDKVAEPTNAEATVLFLDLVGFSTISESLSPAQLVETMNSFFSAAVEEIEKEQGIVTQFQGDAILAVYNVPVQRGDHADAALRTAAAILETISVNTFAGQKLDCRIGVNTGSLVAGAIGAADRLSYTVYGDAVNVASRLEQMNKENGTRILIAEETVRQGSGFDFVEVGLLKVRGRAKDVQTFTFQ
ncbi:MAG: adenylate/guanylate cyclase domain-containing protein, partial [Pseudomonadota bacterium]